MRIISRLLWAVKHDIDCEYVVWSFKDQHFKRFLNYQDARKFRESQADCSPKVMVGVTK